MSQGGQSGLIRLIWAMVPSCSDVNGLHAGVNNLSVFVYMWVSSCACARARACTRACVRANEELAAEQKREDKKRPTSW